MGSNSEATGTVQGADGTDIAYWITGEGPTVVLVHGTTSDHTTYDELRPHLAQERTVVTYDRRGRGASGDGQDGYDFDEELGDAAAVVAEAARRQGSPVDVFGHSFGAFIALGAAASNDDVRSVVAYSPGFGAEYPEGSLERIEEATASDDLDTALQVMFAEVIGMSADEIQMMRNSPVWPVRVAAGGTVARECRADATFLADYSDRLSSIKAPVLVVDGVTNVPPKRAIATRLRSAVPGAELHEMPGQGHAAHHLAAAELADISIGFFDGVGSSPNGNSAAPRP
jgi:pimeloyl-ACP methyl ester carboxylesterase